MHDMECQHILTPSSHFGWHGPAEGGADGQTVNADLRGLQAGLEGVLGSFLGRTEADGGELVEPERTHSQESRDGGDVELDGGGDVVM